MATSHWGGNVDQDVSSCAPHRVSMALPHFYIVQIELGVI